MSKKKDNVDIEINKSGIKFKNKGSKKGKTVKFGSKLFYALVAIVLIAVIAVLVVRFAFPDTWNKFIALFAPPAIEGNPKGDLAVHFVDVGQGDCIIIQLPDGKNMIIDAGGDSANTTDTNCGEKIETYIKSLKITTFDYMMLTHTDGDHVDYMDTVLELTDVKNIYRPAFNSKTEKANGINPKYGTIESVTYDNFIKAVEKEQKAVGAKVNLNIGKQEIVGEGYRFDIYGVEEEWFLKEKVGDEDKISAFERNKVSPMVLLSYNAENDVKRLMFTGDAEGAEDNISGKDGNGGEQLFLETYDTEIKNLDIDLLKVGHHGSSASASVDFLNKLDPEYAVISVGTDGKHGHPTPECIQRLNDYSDIKKDDDHVGIDSIYMTKDYGDIIFRINQAGNFSWQTSVQK